MTNVVLEEIPGKLTLAVEISNCQGSCPGCHSPFLKTDMGDELTPEVIDRLIADNFGIDCFLLLGEGKDPYTLKKLAQHIKSAHKNLEVALYSGREKVEDELFDLFDYVKTGPYIEALGPLNSRATNQRLYHHRQDITARFWQKGIENRN